VPKKVKQINDHLFIDTTMNRIRFDTTGCDPTSVRVSTDGDRIVVRANKVDPADENDDSKTAVGYREYCRKIQKPKDVDHTKFKSYLTSDSVLIVEAPLQPVNPNIRKVFITIRQMAPLCTSNGNISTLLRIS